MGGTVSGGQKARDTNIRKYGKDFYRIQGAKGGSVKGKKGFALMDKQRLAEVSRVGGRNGSRKGVKNV